MKNLKLAYTKSGYWFIFPSTVFTDWQAFPGTQTVISQSWYWRLNWKWWGHFSRIFYMHNSTLHR